MTTFIITSTQISNNVSLTVVNTSTGKTISKFYIDIDNDSVIIYILESNNLIANDGIYNTGNVEIAVVESENKIDLI